MANKLVFNLKIKDFKLFCIDKKIDIRRHVPNTVFQDVPDGQLSHKGGLSVRLAVEEHMEQI